MIVSLEKEFHENRMNEPKIESTWPNKLRLTDLVRYGLLPADLECHCVLVIWHSFIMPL